MKVENGLVELKFNGVKNLQTIGKMVRETAEKYKGIIVTEETIKDCKATLEEIKPVRADIKKVRASVNKELTALVKGQLQEIDDITNILTGVIEPIEQGIEFFAEQQRIAKLEAKKAQFSQHIIAINAELESLPLPLFYTLPVVEFLEEWANKSENAITQILLDTAETVKKDIAAKNDRIDLIKSHCKLLQQEWGLDGDINWLYLKEEVYQDNWKSKLEEMVSYQQEQELQGKEKERLRIEREEETKRKELEKKHQEEIQVIKEQAAEVKQVEIPASDSKKDFKIRIDCVLSAESFEQIEAFIKSVIKTDKISIKEIK